jgi:tetratricopeptide (TPR) repeat protein
MIHALLWMCLFLPPQSAELPVPPDALPLLQSGIDAENRGAFDQAVAAFQKAAELAPNSAIVFLRLGDAYMKQHDYAAAIPPLKRAAELSPDAPAVHQLLGYALLATGYAADAIPHLKIINDSGALGIAQLQAGQAAEAVANLQAALAKSPNDPDLLFYLSRAATALAGQSLDRLRSVDPNSARGHQALGQTDYEMKMLPEAAKEYEQALALRPDLPGLRLELGQVFVATSEWVKAEEQFRAEAKLQPGSSEAAYRLGNALLQEGKMKEAAQELQRSDSLSPDMPETLYALGRSAAISDPDVAAHALERVIELEKGTPLAGQSYLVLAQIHRRQGKTEQAARDMESYRKVQALAARPQS